MCVLQVEDGNRIVGVVYLLVLLWSYIVTSRIFNVFYYEMQYLHSAGSVLSLWQYFRVSGYHLEERVKQK